MERSPRRHRIPGVRSLIGAVILLMVLLPVSAAGQSERQTDDIIRVKMGYNGAPDAEENAVHFFADHFKRILEERSAGRIEVILYPNSQLGSEEQMIEQVMSDPIMNVSSYAGIGTVFPELYAALVPFMFDSYAAGNYFFDASEYWLRCQQEFRTRTGMELVACVEEGGFLAFTNAKREIREPADFKGLRFRAMDDSQVALYRAFGAGATPIPWTELYSALQTGVADGQMNPPMYIILGSLYEVQKYMTMANIQYSMQYLIVNGAWMDSLPEDLRTAVREAADEAKILTRADVEDRVQERTDFIASKGVSVYYPTEAEMEKFRSVGQQDFIDWLLETLGQEWVDLALEGAREANLHAKGL